MRPFFRLVLIVGCALTLAAPLLAKPRAGSKSSEPPRAAETHDGDAPAGLSPDDDERRAREDVTLHWDRAKTLLKQGAYRDALESLDAILAITPNDPRAQLYRSLCELRLKSPPPFGQLSPTQSRALQEQLRQEERAERRAAAQQKALEKQLRKEQTKWDQELEGLERQARAERAKTREAAKEEALRAVQEQLVQPASTTEPPQPPAETPASAQTNVRPAPAPVIVSGGPGAPSVELAPVVVPSAPGQPAEEAPLTPSLVGLTPPPPGAAQIRARQMSVLPDRKIAIAEGDVEVVFENTLLTCDRLTLFTDTQDAYAEGRVRLEEGNQVFRGEMVHYNLENKKGRFLQGTISSPPWHEHGRSVEHIAEGVYEVTPGYITSCELEPPHFKFYGRRAIVFADEKLARMRNVAFIVEQVPFLYLPWMTVADRQSPFFIIPGKKKPWGPFALMGYRYELPIPGNHKGTVRLDWRRFFVWGMGLDHQFESQQLGKGLLKVYFNEEQDLNVQNPKANLPKGAAQNRYRVLWRHRWQPLPDTSVITDIQKYSDVNFRKDLLFREEFVNEDAPESFISVVKNAPEFTLAGLVRKRVNRFQTLTDALPEVTLDVRPERIADTRLFSETHFDAANLQTKRAHSDNDTDVVRVDWFQQLNYALDLFRPVEVTPRAGVRQTFYTKDIQGSDRQGRRNLFSGQFSAGADASLKLFRIFPVTTNAMGLNLNLLRHVLTPTVGYSYIHQPTVPNELLNFAAASGSTNQLSFGLENKLQTKRPQGKGKLQPADLARIITSLPYTFRGSGNKQGGRLGDLAFDVELYPWPWLRLESDWSVPSHFPKSARDNRITAWNLDLITVGGAGTPQAHYAPGIQAPAPHAFEPGPQGAITLMPQGQWFLGLGHRYSQNDKTEDIVQFDWRLSEKWQIGTFHRVTWKEVAGGLKRFNNLREYQYTLRRDLHDWLAEFIYRVDREYGEELFLTLTLKAYPEMPIQVSDSYHQPKIGSQSSPFSPLRTVTP